MTKKYDAYLGILPDNHFAPIQSDRITAPLGQLVIASYAKERISGLEAMAFNCMKTNEKTMEQIVDDFLAAGKKVAVGLTLITGNADNAFNLAKKLNEKGVDVYIGGPETTQIGKEILENRHYIKAAIFGAGEKIIARILEGNPLKFIPNLAYEEKEGKILETKKDPSTVKLDFENIKVDYGLLFDLLKHEGVSYLFGNDCQNAKERCYFCGRISLGFGYRNPEQVWKEIEFLYRAGIREFYNTMDNSGVDIKKLRKFAELKPSWLKEGYHRTFINAQNVNGEAVSYLKKIGVIAAIGLENFQLMQAVGKGSTDVLDNLKSLLYLREAQIPVFLSMVIGIPGETEATLERNKEWIWYTFKDYGQIISQFLISPLMVTTGSKAYYELMKVPEMAVKYSKLQKPYDSTEMSKDYFDHFCSIPREKALGCIKEVYEMIKQLSPSTTVSGHMPKIEADIKGITFEEKEKTIK
ncbi:hypothetical protein HYU07_07555 [Candidatus Woesearchaeota archaeon]|nr:hypothetical protein [Candidatus Woesearchaeota archaeon]